MEIELDISANILEQFARQLGGTSVAGELERKRKTPSEVSYEPGYSHPSKFTRAYKKQFGKLPSKI